MSDLTNSNSIHGILIVILLSLFLLFAFGELVSAVLSPSSIKEIEIVKNPSITHGTLGNEEKVKDYTLFELPNDLDRAQIHNVIFYKSAMWLGTDKGLARIEDKKVTLYKQFSNWPFEWVRDVVATPHGIAVQTHVAQGNTGGNSAGSHVFDPKEETWKKIGNNVLAQTWLDGYLYQATRELIRRSPEKSWEKENIEPVCNKKPTSLKMKAINGEIWLTGDGKSYLGDFNEKFFGCGVMRYNPNNNKSITYKLENGLNHNYGWDLDGDQNGVFVSHSNQHGRLSQYDFDKERWASMKTGGSGNRITVAPNSIWLASASPDHPLIRIDLNTIKTKAFPPLSDEDEYESAIGVDGEKVWFGTYIKHWSNPYTKKAAYTIKSRLGLYIDK